MSKILAELAAEHKRDYITPEDVQEAINAGAERLFLWEELLAILGKQRSLGAEDAGLCCFIAWRFEMQSDDTGES